MPAAAKVAANPASTSTIWPLLAVTGRFQPFHVDDLELLRWAFARAARVLIGITNPSAEVRRAHPASTHRHRADASPWSDTERAALIRAALAAAAIDAARYEIVPFPLEERARWAALVPAGTPQLVRVFSDWEREKLQRFEAAGYPVVALHGDAARRVSASDIRAALAAGAAWQHWVPPGARELLASWTATPA
jgi:nicotinamide mononucleotide adenylyltransferase